MANHAKLPSVLLFLCGVSFATLTGGAVYAQAPGMPGAIPPSMPASPQMNPPSAPGAPGAQQANLAAPGQAAAPLAMPPIKLTPEELNAPFRGSFFLTPQEVDAIRQAMLGRPVDAEALGASLSITPVVIPPHRVISVSGILYRSPKDWIVWMNGQKVTPDKLLPEIVDIKVDSSSYVKLKWRDIGLNSVIAITLRPHQTYDIGAGVLLPGTE